MSEMTSRKRLPMLPCYLRGAYAETIAKVLGVSLATARAMCERAASRDAIARTELAAVAGGVKSDEEFEARLAKEREF